MVRCARLLSEWSIGPRVRFPSFPLRVRLRRRSPTVAESVFDGFVRHHGSVAQLEEAAGRDSVNVWVRLPPELLTERCLATRYRHHGSVAQLEEAAGLNPVNVWVRSPPELLTKRCMATLCQHHGSVAQLEEAADPDSVNVWVRPPPELLNNNTLGGPFVLS